MPPKPATIEDYIVAAPPEVRDILQEIRRIVQARVPTAVETIAYQMPAFRQRRIFFYFAAWQNHIGIYPPVEGDAALQAELAPYRGPKGNLQFPLNQPIPYDLIGRVAEALVQERG